LGKTLRGVGLCNLFDHLFNLLNLLSGGLDDMSGLGFGDFAGGDTADLSALKELAPIGSTLVDPTLIILMGRARLTKGGDPLFSF
jgi:hypothetical protein